jgi:hypothetical protein
VSVGRASSQKRGSDRKGCSEHNPTRHDHSREFFNTYPDTYSERNQQDKERGMVQALVGTNGVAVSERAAETLRSAVEGAVLRPGDDGFEQARGSGTG